MEPVKTQDTFRLQLLQSLMELRSGLRNYGRPRKMLVQTLRVARELFGADEGAVAYLSTRSQTTELIFSMPSGANWNLGLLNDYIKRRRPDLPSNTIVARIMRRLRPWGVIALRFDHDHLDADLVRALWSIADVVSEAIEQYDNDRVDQLRRRIEVKVANRQRPKDIIYDILHDLRELTRYNHSASFWTSHAPGGSLQLIAEQIAWTKAKSRRIGRRIDLNTDLRRELATHDVRIYRRDNSCWRDAEVGNESCLAAVLDSGSDTDDDIVTEQAMLCAVVGTPDGSTGVLRLAALNPRALGEFEARMITRLQPLMSLALQFLHRTGALEDQVLQAERKYALANLTRGIAHDVNNALGSVLPLVQQIRSDLERAALREDLLAEDLAVIESGLQTCRRVFAGMLACAHSSDRSVGSGNLRRAVDSASSVIQDRLRRYGIELVVDIPPELPALRGNQGDIIQIFLNLFSNALDAMADGGTMTITAKERGAAVHVEVRDTGQGIPERLLPTVFDPFITTKAHGNGLGLSICRSIMWEIGGELNLLSREGEGTIVMLDFPIQAAGAME